MRRSESANVLSGVALICGPRRDRPSGRSYRDRPRLPQVADRDDHRSAAELPPGRPRLRSVEQLDPAFLLRIVRVFDLQPSDAPAIRIGQAFGDDAFEVVGTL